MKLSNLPIRYRLMLGFGIIIFLLVALEYNNISDVNRIANISKELHEHPFTVSNSVREIKIEINAMHRWMKDIVLSKNTTEIEQISNLVTESENVVFTKFDVVFEKFLGDQRDVTNAFSSFKNWKIIRDEVIELMINGKVNEAVAITQGKGMDHINIVNEKVDLMIDFANKKAESLREEANLLKESIIQNFIILAIITILISIIIALIITRSISNPIKKMVEKLDHIYKNNFNKKLVIPNTHEIGILENSIGQLESVSKQLGEEVDEHKNTTIALDKYKTELEELVEKRTQELTETKELLSNAFDGAAIGMVLVKPQGNFYWTNQSFSNIVGYSENELSTLTFNDITHPDDHLIGVNVIKRLLDDEIKQTEFEKRYIHKNGAIIFVKLTSSLIKGNEDKSFYFFTQVQDISAQVKAEIEIKNHSFKLKKIVEERTADLEEKTASMEKTQQALTFLLEDVNEIKHELEIANEKKDLLNQELEAFSYSVSHDLRAPLRAINGFTTILLEDYVEKFDDEGKRIGEVIKSNAKKMGYLIDDLLTFSRIGRSTMNYSTIDMKTMVNSIYYEASTPEIREKCKLTIGDLMEVEGDTNMMRQVWMNLISNSIKFSSKIKNPIIMVDCIKEGNNIIYSIKDNGAGFNMAYIDKLFGVFQRLHSEKEFEGTGVGLALVQRIIHRHNGEIWGESEINKGAKFNFSLPI